MKCVKVINETSWTFSFKYPLVWSQNISRIIKYIDFLGQVILFISLWGSVQIRTLTSRMSLYKGNNIDLSVLDFVF